MQLRTKSFKSCSLFGRNFTGGFVSSADVLVFVSVKRVLIITYYWPPAGGAGVQRWLKFVKYLPASGWQPTVVVPAGVNYPVEDACLQEEVGADVEIIRCPILEPLSLLEALKGGRIPQASGASSGSGDGSALKRALNWIRGNVFIPDARMLWIRPTSRRIRQWLAEHPVDVLVSTGPPHSVHLIARNVKRGFPSLPWLADFRDPWSDMDYLADFHLSGWAQRRHRRLEQAVVAEADEVVVTAPSAAVSLMGRNVREGEKGVWIPNGFDAEDGFNRVQPPADGPLVLGFFGALYGSRNAPGLWRAIASWNRDGRRRPIRLAIFGSVVPEVLADLQRQLPSDAWEMKGHIPHERVPDAMAACHGLVLVQNNNRTGQRTLPGKVFEYLATRRPMVVGGALESDLEELVVRCGFAMSAVDDEAGFARQLHAVERNEIGTVSPDAFRRDRLAGQLASVLNRLIKSA